MEINFTYKVPYKPNLDFEFEQYDEDIGVEAYEDPLMEGVHIAALRLKKNPASRTAIAQLFKPQKFESCLLSVQFQLHEEKLYVTATYRSQAAIFRARDEKVLTHIASTVLTDLEMALNSEVEITCNVGNYHITKYNK